MTVTEEGIAVEAVYREDIRRYVVKYVVEGVEYAWREYEYGQVFEDIAAPLKEPIREFGFIFTDWIGRRDTVTENFTVYAVFVQRYTQGYLLARIDNIPLSLQSYALLVEFAGLLDREEYAGYDDAHAALQSKIDAYTLLASDARKDYDQARGEAAATASVAFTLLGVCFALILKQTKGGITYG